MMLIPNDVPVCVALAFPPADRAFESLPRLAALMGREQSLPAARPTVIHCIAALQSC
jgi:hypothetical protein